MNKKMSKKQFVETILSEVIHVASDNGGDNGWVDHLEYYEGMKHIETWECVEHADGFAYKFVEYDKYVEEVTIVCKNGARYDVNVACDSHLAIIQDVMKEVMRH